VTTPRTNALTEVGAHSCIGRIRSRARARWCSNERFIAGSIVSHNSTPVDERWRSRFATGLKRVDSSVTEPVDSLPALLDAPQCLAPVALGGQPL